MGRLDQILVINIAQLLLHRDILLNINMSLWPMQETPETQVQYLGWDDPLEKEMTTNSSVLT